MSKYKMIIAYSEEVLSSLAQERCDDAGIEGYTSLPRDCHTLLRLLNTHGEEIERIMGERNLSIYRNLTQLIGLLHSCHDISLPDLSGRYDIARLLRNEFWRVSPCEPQWAYNIAGEVKDLIDLFLQTLIMEEEASEIRLALKGTSWIQNL